MLVWDCFRFALDASLCLLPCRSRLTSVQGIAIVGGWSSVFLWTSGVFEWRAWLHRFSLHLSLPALCLLRGKIGLGFLSAMQINPCSRASLEWKLGSRCKEISLKCRLFPPCTRYSWTLVFAACFEDVISQAVAFSPLCSYFSRQEVESEVYGNRGRRQGLRRINFLMKYWKPIWS